MNNLGYPIGNEFSGEVNIDGNLDVNGDIDVVNLNVSDTLTADTIITNIELEVKDPLITCGVGNLADTQNLGLLEEYASSGVKYAGIVRSKDDKKHYIIKDATSKPSLSTDITTLGRGDLVLTNLNGERINLEAVGSNGCVIEGYGHRGTLASPANTLTGDVLMDLTTAGRSDFGTFTGSRIKLVSTSDWTTLASMNTAIYFEIRAPNGAGSSIYVPVIIDKDGLLINATSFNTNFRFPTNTYNVGDVMKISTAGGLTEWAAESGGGGTLQSSYDASTTPQITTDATNPTLTVKAYTTNTPLEVTNSSDTRVFSVDSTGSVSGNVLSCNTLEADNATVDNVGYKNGVGTDRFTQGWDATDELHIDNAVGTKLQSIDQSGNIEFFNSSGTSTMKIQDTGEILIGTGTELGTMTITDQDADGPNLSIVNYSTVNTPAFLDLFRARGTEGAPSAVAASDFIASFEAWGHTGSAFTRGAQINMQTTQPWTPTASGTRIVFINCANDTTSLQEKIIIENDGRLIINGGGNQAVNFQFPISRGTTNQILKDTGSGVLGWATNNLQEAYDNSVSSPQLVMSGAKPSFSIRGHDDVSTITSFQNNSGDNVLDIVGDSIQCDKPLTVNNDFKYDKGCAEFYAQGNLSATTTTLANAPPTINWYPVVFSDTSSNSGQAVGFTVDTVNPNSGRITYNGTRNRICHCGVTLSFTCNTNNVLCEFGLRLNGTHLHAGHVKMFYANGIGKFESSAIHAMPTLSNGDYLELEVSSDTAGAQITVSECNIFVISLPNEI